MVCVLWPFEYVLFQKAEDASPEKILISLIFVLVGGISISVRQAEEIG